MIAAGTRFGPYEIVAPIGGGRHGGGVARPRHAARSQRRDQDPAGRIRAERPIQTPLRARSEDDLAAQPSEYLHALRRRRELPRHGVVRRGVARRQTRERSAAARAGAALRRADRRRARQGASRGNRASRSETRQHHDHEVGREAARFRPGERWRADRSRRRHAAQAADAGRNDRRHVPVHGAGAARRRRSRTRGRTSSASAQCSTRWRPANALSRERPRRV